MVVAVGCPRLTRFGGLCGDARRSNRFIVAVCVCGGGRVIRASCRLEQLSLLQLKRHTTEQIVYTRARRVVGIVVVYNTTCKTYR